MRSNTQQQTLALAAVVQAASLVEQLARTGDISSASLEPLIKSVFVQNPENFDDIYGDPKQLSLGCHNLLFILGQSDQRISPDIARYTLSLLHLEGKLRHQGAMLSQLGQGIQASVRQAEHFGLSHENTLAALADLYKQTLSNLSFRIQVTGNPTYLQNPHTANKVRALLLAGIRAAILWRQCGGRRWQLVFKRKAYSKTIMELKSNLS